MDDEELTRLAAEELIRDAKKFMAKREAEFRATQMKRPMQTNKTFLNNIVRNTLQHNNQLKMNELRNKIRNNRIKKCKDKNKNKELNYSNNNNDNDNSSEKKE